MGAGAPRELRAVESEYIDDEPLLRSWVHTHGRAVEACIARYERDVMIREEIFADVVRLAFERVGELRGLSQWQLRAWLLRTARFMTANASRRAVSRRRAYQRLAAEPVVLASPGADDFVADFGDEERLAHSTQLREALDGLRDDYRRVLILDALGENGPKIAMALGITPQAARSRLMRARAAFIAAYTGHDIVDDPGSVTT